jgi:hypothetical protein
MNAIIVMAELLSETPMTPDQRRLVHVFRSAGETLLNFINDILDLSKVEAGQIQLDSVSFDLLQLLDKTCEVMALRADEKGLELACHFASGVPANLVGDPTRIWDSLPSSPKMEKNLRPWNFPDHGMEPWPFGTRYSSKFPPLPSIQLKQ